MTSEFADPSGLFMMAVALGAVAALGALLNGTKPVTIRSVLAAIIFHGTVAGGLAMGAYESFHWQKYPWRVISVAILWGAGFITFKWVQEFIKSNVAHLRLPDSDEQKDT